MIRLGTPTALLLAGITTTVNGHADQAISVRDGWTGALDYVLTGVELATDTGGSSGVDSLALPAVFDVTIAQLPAAASVTAAYLYWGGSQADSACAGSGDDTVLFGVPGIAAESVTADVCYCSDSASPGYDIWICSADVTPLYERSGATHIGSHSVDGYSGLIANSATDCAAAALFLVGSGGGLPGTTVALHDGIATQLSGTQNYSFSGFNASAATGSLSFFALEGDVGGSEGESVSVNGAPGAPGP